MKTSRWRVAAAVLAAGGAAAVAPAPSRFGFDLSVDRTPFAVQRLAAAHEGIAVSASCDGGPTAGGLRPERSGTRMLP